jgi:hypothetical protein
MSARSGRCSANGSRQWQAGAVGAALSRGSFRSPREPLPARPRMRDRVGVSYLRYRSRELVTGPQSGKGHSDQPVSSWRNAPPRHQVRAPSALRCWRCRLSCTGRECPSFQVSNAPVMPRDISTRHVSHMALCTRSQRTSP